MNRSYQQEAHLLKTIKKMIINQEIIHYKKIALILKKIQTKQSIILLIK